jgi:restriction system protein
MGYDEVVVTSPSNDKGVDVIGRIQLGITAVREVIQVKRHRKTIQRKELDALRGSLHRFQAVRGTLITTSRFSSGTEKAAFEWGAAPITLIDGEKLIDLLAAHEIGVKKRKIEVWELDASAFGEEET